MFSEAKDDSLVGFPTITTLFNADVILSGKTAFIRTPSPASLDVYYVLYLVAISVATTLELATLQWLHLTAASTLLPLALVLQCVPSVVGDGEVARLFTFSRRGFTAQTTRIAFFSGLLRFGVFFFTYLALTSTNGAMSQPVFAAQFHCFIHALRLLISRKRSLVRWNGAILIVAGLACVAMAQTNPDFALARPAMTASALAIYTAYLQFKLCVVPIACLLAAQLCEIGMGEQDVDVLEWHATGTLALTGFALYAVALPLIAAPNLLSVHDYNGIVSLVLVLLTAYARRALRARFSQHVGQLSQLELSSSVNLARHFAIITTIFLLSSGLGSLRSRVLAGVSNILTMAGAMAIEADTALEARASVAVVTAATEKKKKRK